jgi:hypothetical protein
MNRRKKRKEKSDERTRKGYNEIYTRSTETKEVSIDTASSVDANKM